MIENKIWLWLWFYVYFSRGKKEKMPWNCKRSFFKNHKNRFPGWEFAAEKKPGAAVNPPLKLNERLLNVLNKNRLPPGSCFCDFRIVPFAILPPFLPSDPSKSLFSQMFFSRCLKGYLYPNMIKFDGVDFSERRSEEWCFFWRSVYFIPHYCKYHGT